MALRSIVVHPDPRLAQICAPVTAFDAGLDDLISDMFDTMYAAPGRGLAAPQVGVMSRLFVMDATWKDGAGTPLVMVNPKVTARSENLAVLEEGCLSIPDTPRTIARPDWVAVSWQDAKGQAHTGKFDGFKAACIQHEADHLDGRLILDHPEAK